MIGFANEVSERMIKTHKRESFKQKRAEAAAAAFDSYSNRSH